MPRSKGALGADLSTPRIGPRSTAAAWVIGTALLAAGAVAVFLTANAAGSVALVAAGTAFILTAAWRHLPSNIKAGGYELIWTAYETGRQQVVDDLSKSVEKGDDIKAEIARLEKETRLVENEQRLRMFEMLVSRGLLDHVEFDADSMREALLRQVGPEREPDS